jgi:hypothetical protein
LWQPTEVICARLPAFDLPTCPTIKQLKKNAPDYLQVAERIFLLTRTTLRELTQRPASFSLSIRNFLLPIVIGAIESTTVEQYTNDVQLCSLASVL